MRSEAQWLAVMSGADRSASAAAWRAGLRAATPLYRGGLQAHRVWQWSRKRRLPRPTLCVGNLTAGGTGKTPMVMEVCERLLAAGRRPAVLMRGYRVRNAADPQSDEAEVLRAGLPVTVPIRPDPRRWRAAAAVVRDHPEVGCFVMDDGFQHRVIHRDVDLVLIDVTRPFGFDALLPRGLLREPKSALRRADAVVLTRCDRVDAAAVEAVDAEVERVTGARAIARTRHAWSGFRRGSDTFPLDALRGRRVVAVSGIGNPGGFESQLRDPALGIELLDHRRLNDHHAYSRAEVASLLNAAVERRADAVVTTEKDWVKWRRLGGRKRLKLTVPVWRPVLGLGFESGSEALDKLLARLG